MKSYLSSGRAVEAPYTTLSACLKKWANEKPDTCAFVVHSPGEDPHRISYGELYSKSVRLAKGLLRLGIGKEDVVGIGGNNSIEYVICMFAVQMTRAVPLHLTFHEKDGSDLKRMVSIIGKCKMIMYDPGHADRHSNILDSFVSSNLSSGKVQQSDIPGLEWIVLHSESKKSKRFSINQLYYDGEDVALPETDPDDIAAILCTSGSTGFPKAIPYTHFAKILNGYHMESLLQTRKLDKEANPTIFNDRPFYWTGGYPQWSIATGGTRITLSNILSLPSPAAVIDFTIEVLKKEKPASAMMLTPFLLELLHRKDHGVKIGSVLTGGQPVPATLLSGLGLLYEKLSVVYGSSEMGWPIGYVYDKSTTTLQKYLGGRPLAGVDLKVVDPDGTMVDKGFHGERTMFTKAYNWPCNWADISFSRNLNECIGNN